MNVSFIVGSRSRPARAGSTPSSSARAGERDEHAPRRVEIAEELHPPAEPRRHPVERLLAGVSARIRFTAPSKYCTSTYRAPFSYARRAIACTSGCASSDASTRQHLIGLHVGADGDDEVRIAIQNLRVHDGERY